MSEFIRTKQLFELKKGQLIGLGFGNIAHSDADIVCISAFNEPSFVSSSSIGSINELLLLKGNINLKHLVNDDFIINGFQLIDISMYGLPFKKILLISMGSRELFKMENKEILSELVMNNIKMGLEKAKRILSNELSSFSIDITALGTKYGSVRRKECFDLLITWATELFICTPKVSFLRFVAFELDTFIDFYEAIHRLQKIKPENELAFSANYNAENFSQFKPEISSALRNLDDNPRGVIITCRTIIEMIVKSRLSDSSIKLADGIHSLKESCPPSIYSYLTTCRLLGNFSNHDHNFVPTRRDAEGILLLTLRIVEWHLSKIPFSI